MVSLCVGGNYGRFKIGTVLFQQCQLRGNLVSLNLKLTTAVFPQFFRPRRTDSRQRTLDVLGFQIFVQLLLSFVRRLIVSADCLLFPLRPRRFAQKH
jgi:hypothetical protein